MKPPIRLLVTDDHTLFRRGLIALLSQYDALAVVGEAADAGEAQRRAAELQPDVILLDNHLPGVNGIPAIGGLRDVAPAARIIVLTVSEDEADLSAALRAGAHGYLLKTIDGDALLAAVLRCMAGECVVSPDMTPKLVSALRGTLQATAEATQPEPDPLAVLSPRELDTLRGIARGESNKEIARTLAIAETTVKIHVQHILRKLNLSSRVQAAVFATEHGI